ncbi:MAG: nicotinate-nucleotide--dimethylbenzimidazole phosphoribosyltransferase, partial [Pseudomonadota bacterium]
MNKDLSRNEALSVTDLQGVIDNKTKPPGSLGRIEELALQIGMLQKTLEPRAEKCRLIIFAADHGIVESGVSAYPQEVTQQMVMNFLNGGAAANVFARANGVTVQVVDAGVAGQPIEHPNLLSCRIGSGTANSVATPAMTSDQFDLAMKFGRELGDVTVTDALCLGEMGIGNTSAAALILHKILGLSLDELTGHGTGLDDEGFTNKLSVLKAAASRVTGDLAAEKVLIEWGGFEIAMMTGAMLSAASRGILVMVDGFIATAAATAALTMEPSAKDAMVFAHKSAERGHGAALDALSIRPLLDLDMRLGEGTGALLAWPLIRSAAAMLKEMASFDSAGV